MLAEIPDVPRHNAAIASAPAVTDADSIRALRHTANRLREQNERQAACEALRALRRKSVLRPAEHQYLFQALRAEGRAALVDRYVRRIRRLSPTPKNWRAVALVLWSEHHLPELYAWAQRHPRGKETAAQALLQFASASAGDGDLAIAETLHAGILETFPDSHEVLAAVIRQKLKLGQSESALPLAEDFLSAARALARAVVDAELERLKSSRDGEEPQQAGGALQRLIDAAGFGKCEPEASALLQALRARKAAGAEPAELYESGLQALGELWPFETLRPRNQNAIASIARMVQVAGRASKAGMDSVSDWMAGKSQPNSALSHWVAAMIHLAASDREGALSHLDAALSATPTPRGVILDIQHEIAMLHFKDGRIRDACCALEARPAQLGPALQSYYGPQLEPLHKIITLCGKQEFYPECVVDAMLEEAAAEPMPFDPIPGHLVTIISTLGSGGGERQAVNIIKAMTNVAEVTAQTVIVDSVDGEDGFFLPEVQHLPLKLHVTGRDETGEPVIQEGLPLALQSRPRISQAIDLLRPTRIRADVIQFCHLLAAARPEVVHIRQDRMGAALACAILGVPKFFIHRGSLARDLWTNLPGPEIFLRVMGHSYRRLMDRTVFSLVNNSRAGTASDISWIGHGDTSRFRTVYNAVDFDGLGNETSRNLELKAQLGIAPDAPVIGGVFRMDPVKRPLLWAEAAHLVLMQIPDAHFLIVGEHRDLTAEVTRFAEARGFSERLHMPGAMADVANWYRTMDLLLLTSEREGLPNVNIEAQHFGIPVVSADVGGAGETFERDVTGFLVAADAPAETYAERIVYALSNRVWYEKARARGPAFVHERFQARNTVESLLAVYGLRNGDAAGVRCAAE